MEAPSTPSLRRFRPGEGSNGPIDLPDLLRVGRRPGAVGTSVDDQGQTPIRSGLLRSRAEAFTPTPAISRKQVRIAAPERQQNEDAPAGGPVATREKSGTPASGNENSGNSSNSGDTDSIGSGIEAPAPRPRSAARQADRPVRQAAIESNIALSRQAQQAALGLGVARGSPELGSSLGISAASQAATDTAKTQLAKQARVEDEGTGEDSEMNTEVDASKAKDDHGTPRNIPGSGRFLMPTRPGFPAPGE
ncbi:hypothetical protein V8E36_001500 [Tilletia maclaganii]